MVLVRFAYGFLNKLRLHSISVQTMPLGSARLIIPCVIATTGCCPTDSQAISCLLGEGVSPLRLSASFRGSSVPCAFVFFPALALSFGPTAALIQRDRMISAFRLFGFDWFHDDICPQRQYPRQEGGRLDFGALTLTSFYVGYSSADRFILSVS